MENDIINKHKQYFSNYYGINLTAKWRHYFKCTGFLRCLKILLNQDL